ncbi:MAG: hypothetical protein RL012_95 [Bacteroidota bacterium]
MTCTNMQHNTSLLLLGKRNYPLLVVGIFVIPLGFTLVAPSQKMSGFGVLGFF